MTDDLKKSSEVENIYKILESGFQENKSIKQYALPNARQWLGARFFALWVIPIYLLKKLNKISNSSVFVKPYTPTTWVHSSESQLSLIKTFKTEKRTLQNIGLVILFILIKPHILAYFHW